MAESRREDEERALAFAGLALWMGFGRRDPFALFFVLLAGLCALAGYGAVASLRQR